MCMQAQNLYLKRIQHSLREEQILCLYAQGKYNITKEGELIGSRTAEHEAGDPHF